MPNAVTKKKRSHLFIDEADVVGKVIVKPRKMAKLVLGMYESSMPTPRFIIHYSPEGGDAVDASLFKFEADDYYTLVYHFQNYTDTTYYVTITSE